MVMVEELEPELGQQDCTCSVRTMKGSKERQGRGGRGGEGRICKLALTTLIGTKSSADAPDFHFKIGRGVPTGKDLLASLWHKALSLLSNCAKGFNAVQITN
jgi:hypothetical protein